MEKKVVSIRIIVLLARHFETYDLTSRGYMVAAAKQLFVVIGHFGKRQNFAELKVEAAKLLEETTGIENPDYSPESKLETLRFMSTVIFQKETAVRRAA